MQIERRTLIAGALALGACATQPSSHQHGAAMYGLTGKMLAKAGHRDEIVAVLLGTGSMPGCRLYVVATDPADASAIWITEVWDTKAAHDASLQLPQVQAAIAQARPFIEGFGERFETVPVGGIGLGS